MTERSPVSGIDDCATGSICLWLDDQGIGECVAMCGGTPDAPACDPGTECLVTAGGLLAVCLPPCDPLTTVCDAGSCIPGAFGGFACFPFLGPAAPLGGACEHHSQCPAGSVCTGATASPSCIDDDCACTPWCDLDATSPEAVCDAGRACVPWFEPDRAPVGLGNLGYCA